MQAHSIESCDGFWVPALCDKCNKTTGAKFGTSYADFVEQIASATPILEREDRAFIALKRIHPLRVMKQMFSMFLCAAPYAPAEPWRALQDFVLHRDSRLSLNAPSVYLYMNTSRQGRIVPCCGIVDLQTHVPLVISEISWPPLGIVFSFHPNRLFDDMQDISNWGSFAYDQAVNVSLMLPMHRVNTHYPLGFGSAKRIQQKPWIYMYHVPKGSTSQLNYSAVVEPRR